MFLAKALYDNVAEAPDELTFRRGDVLTVMETNPGGLDGWWLCSLNNHQGIAPGNRLRILAGMKPTDRAGVTTLHQPQMVSCRFNVPRLTWLYASTAKRSSTI